MFFISLRNCVVSSGDLELASVAFLFLLYSFLIRICAGVKFDSISLSSSILICTSLARLVLGPKPDNKETNSLHGIVLNSSERIETPYSDLKDEIIVSKSSIRSYPGSLFPPHLQQYLQQVQLLT